MFAKKIKYTDYNGAAREETFYFNLNKAEIMEMELGVAGGMTQLINMMIASEDGPGLAKFYKEMILKAYGEKSLDGKRFIKNQEVRDAFEQTDAYSELYMELVTDAEKASEFVRGIMPTQAVKAAEDFKKPELTLTDEVVGDK